MKKIPGRNKGYRFRNKNPEVHNFTNELLEDEEIKDINKIKIDNPFSTKTTSLNNINRFKDVNPKLLLNNDTYFGFLFVLNINIKHKLNVIIPAKVFETKDAILKGADEIDMVINVGKAKEHDYDYIEKEIKEIRNACLGHTLKVIIETCYLDDDEKVNVCKKATLAKADFVKTSTGFGTGGANAHDVKLMKESIDKGMQVKASGGVRTYENAMEMVDAGATRIGASSSIKIMESAK